MIILSLPLLIAGCAGANGSAPPEPQPFRAQVRYLNTTDGRLAYYERGQGRELLLLTGTGSTMAEWDPALLRRLAQKNRLILLDYPGLGKSSGSVPQSFALMADQIERFLAARGRGSVNVLGWSMGGFVAQQLAIRHPERVERIILAATNPGGRQAVLGSPTDQQRDSSTETDDQAVLFNLYPRNRSGQREGQAFLRRLDRASESGEIPDDFTVKAAAKRRQVRAEDPWLGSEANWRSLAQIKSPVLAAAGRRDPVTPAANMRRIASQVNDGRLALFPGSHAFLFSDRGHFAATSNRFLSGR